MDPEVTTCFRQSRVKLPGTDHPGMDEALAIRFGGDRGTETVVVFRRGQAMDVGRQLKCEPVRSQFDAALSAIVALPDVALMRETIGIDGNALRKPFEQMVSRAAVERRVVREVSVRTDQTGTDFWIDMLLADGERVDVLVSALLLAYCDERLNP